MHQTPHVLVKPKVGRPRSKSAHARKITDSSLKPVIPQPEQRVIEIDSDIEFPFYPDRLPDLPPVEPDQCNFPADQPQQNQEPNQVANQPLGTPTGEPIQPVDAPAEEPNQPNQPDQPNQPLNLPDPTANPQQLNWPYFKPVFAGKAEKDAKGHLLRTIDWMDTHNLPDDQKVRQFCLTLTGEARLWYETIRQV